MSDEFTDPTNEDNAINKSNLRRRLENGWDELHEFLDSLSDEQKTEPTDAAGWTVKDHVIHLALWEDSLTALLEGESRAEALGVPDELWGQDIDLVNADIQQRYKDMPLDEVMKTLEHSHERMVAKIETLTDADLMRPHSHYQPHSGNDAPVINWIVGNSFEHFAEHLPWMKAIAEGE